MTEWIKNTRLYKRIADLHERYIAWEDQFIEDEEDVMYIRIGKYRIKLRLETDLGKQEILKIPNRYFTMTLLWLFYFIFIAPEFRILFNKFGSGMYYPFHAMVCLLFGYLFRLDSDYTSWFFAAYGAIISYIYLLICDGEVMLDYIPYILIYTVAGMIGQRLSG